MKKNNYGLYATAAAILVVGALWVGVPVATLATLGLVLACPLMMIFMMRGMHGGQNQHSQGHGPGDSDQHDHHAMR